MSSALTGDYTSYAEAVGEGRSPYESHVFYLSEEDTQDEDSMRIIEHITMQDKLNREQWLTKENSRLQSEIEALREELGYPDNDYADSYYD